MEKVQDLTAPGQKKQKLHLPVIEAPDKVKKGEYFNSRVVVNKDIAIPNEIDPPRFWFTVYFLPNESERLYQVVQPLFAIQKEAVEGIDSIHNRILYQASLQLKPEKTGTIYAAAYCPIHRLSQSRSRVEVI
jgi:superoxide reductase